MAGKAFVTADDGRRATGDWRLATGDWRLATQNDGSLTPRVMVPHAKIITRPHHILPRSGRVATRYGHRRRDLPRNGRLPECREVRPHSTAATGRRGHSVQHRGGP